MHLYGFCGFFITRRFFIQLPGRSLDDIGVSLKEILYLFYFSRKLDKDIGPGPEVGFQRSRRPMHP